MLKDKYNLIYNFIAEEPTHFILLMDNFPFALENHLVSSYKLKNVQSFSECNIDDILNTFKWKNKKTYLPMLNRIALLCKLLTLEGEGYVSYKEFRKYLYEVTLDYGADKFSQLHKNQFKKIEQLDLNKCVDIYFDNLGLQANHNESKHLLLYFLIRKEKFIKKGLFGSKVITDYSECAQELFNLIERKSLKNYSNKLLNASTKQNKLTISDVDLMTGEEFESFVASIFQKIGFKTEKTKLTGDQGIDIIAINRNEKVGIQAKRYTGKVSNSAIQQVVAGLSHYKLTKGIVITNSRFTKSAIELAHSNNIILWDRDLLTEKIREIN